MSVFLILKPMLVDAGSFRSTMLREARPWTWRFLWVIVRDGSIC